MSELKKIAEDIRKIISEYQEKNQLSFIEDTHTYFIKNDKGIITSDMPSVSTVLKAFYNHFDSNSTKSFQNCGGDKELEKQLLLDWDSKGKYSTNIGSRVHYILEKELVSIYGNYKEVRQPIFNCDHIQLEISDKMVKAGKNFIELMHKRGAVLLDTEIVLGSNALGYFGQPDKVWLMLDNEGNLGIVITDWKTNKKENMSQEIKPWTKNMLQPFSELIDNSLSHYKIQLPLYAKLILHILENTKYKNIKLFGCVIVHLMEEGSFDEYRIHKNIINTVLNMDVKNILSSREDHIKKHKFLEQRDKNFINS